MKEAGIYNPKDETMDREELEQLQIERLQSTLNRVCRNVAFYRAAFDDHGINLEQLRDLRALADLPLTTQDDLRRSYPYDMFAVPLHDIVRIHSTGGGAATRSSSATRATTCATGPSAWPGCWRPPASPCTTLSRWPWTTTSRPGPSASTKGPSRSGPRSSPPRSPPASRNRPPS